MHVLIINLAGAHERMALQERQMRELSLSWERLEAVTPQTLSPGPEDPLWQQWQRPLRVTEMALFASHLAAWRRVLDHVRPCLILEDDALLAASAPAFLHQLAKVTKAGGGPAIDHVTLETRSRKKLVSRKTHPHLPMRRLWQDRTGAAAYVLFPSGAEKLVTRAPRIAALADAAIAGCYDLASWQTDPALAIQVDQSAAYGIRPPITAQSSVDAVARPGTHDLPSALRRAYRRRRLLAQLRMGARQLAHLHHAERRQIGIASDWPELG